VRAHVCVECTYIRIGGNQSGLGWSIVTMVQPADSLLRKNPIHSHGTNPTCERPQRERPLATADGHSLCRAQSRVAFAAGLPRQDYKFAPKASCRPSRSFTTNSRECHGMLASPSANSTPRAALSLPKMLSGANAFEISNIQEARDGGPTNLASRM
jgi:hypothetical protein